MGGAVSSGSDNNELVDNLMRGKYIRTTKVEQVFRALDRADYMTPEGYDHAYKDLAWRNGPLHLSSPCIYSEVMEGLELFEGLSFLNIGSGTGYLSSLVGLILGSQGINHGVEVHPEVYEFSLAKLASLLENSPVIDDFDFCQPKFFNGNGLCLVPLRSGYDRVYCGAACPTEYVSYFRNLIKVGGILVMPLNDMLVQVRRVSRNKWVSRSLLSVTFAPLRVPTREETAKLLKLDEQRPPRLEVLSRAAVRAALRAGVMLDHPELSERARRPLPRVRPSCPRRICIPVEAPAAVEGLNVLHDLDAENGADEMNALLSLVISMGQNRVAGALRYGRFETGSNSSDDSDAPTHQRRLPDDSADDSDAADRSHSESGADEQLDDYDSDGDSARRKSKTLKRSSRNRSSKPQKRDSNGHGSRTQKRDSRSKDTKTQKRDSHHRDSKTNKRELRSSKNQKQESERTQEEEEEEERGSGRWLRSRRRGAARAAGEGGARAAGEGGARAAGEGGAPSTSRGPARALTPHKLSKRKSKDCKENSKQDKESCPSVSKDNSSVPPRESGTRAGMEWEESKTDTVEASDEDAEPRPKSKAKRQKLDSGIGESTPGSSSPARSRSQSDSDDYTDIEDEDEDDEEKCPKATERRAAGGADARCVRVSQLMRRGVLQLPLPPALKRFVNLDRANEH